MAGNNQLMEDHIFSRMLNTPGYRTEFAIGTTYSLDMATFLSIPFSLGLMEEPDENMLAKYIVPALKIGSSKMAVFCNYADINVPDSKRGVYCTFLENTIFTVNADDRRSNKKIVNFHPKVWIIKEVPLDEHERSRIKLIVMSRNITMSNNLDVTCEIVGEIGGRHVSPERQKKHKPLCDFIFYLKGYANYHKAQQMESLIEDIRCIESFSTEDSFFDDYDFFPMGFGEYNGKECFDRMLRFKNEAIVVSPFLDEWAVSHFENGIQSGFACSKRKTLITCYSSITPRIVESFGRDNIYVVKEGLLDNEENDPTDLHAKIFYTTEREEDGSERHFLYSGSTNATKNGFCRNVEFLVRLRFGKRKGPYEIVRDMLFFEDGDGKYEPMTGDVKSPDMSAMEEERRKTRALRLSIASISEAQIKKSGDKYDVSLSVNTRWLESEATVAPLLCPASEKKLTGSCIEYEGLSLSQLSEFYIVNTEGLSRLVKIPTKGLPYIERDKEILRTHMTRDEFYDCISFLMSDSKALYSSDFYHSMLRGGGSSAEDCMTFDGLYEDLLRNFYERPDVKTDIQKFKDSMPAEVMPPEFDVLYNAIDKAHSKMVKR